MVDPLVVIAALADLTPNQREAYIDRVVLQRTDTEIAATLGVTRSRVGQLATRAGEILRGTLAAEHAEAA